MYYYTKFLSKRVYIKFNSEEFIQDLSRIYHIKAYNFHSR